MKRAVVIALFVLGYPVAIVVIARSTQEAIVVSVDGL